MIIKTGSIMAAKFTINDLPKGDFHLHDIANRYYPECAGYDSDGRTFNKAASTVSRLLRRMRWVLELDNGYYYNGR